MCIRDRFKPSIVFHEAAQTMVQSSMENPGYDCDVNLLGLINVLDACRKVKVEQFLMPSSAAVYGDLAVLPSVSYTHLDVYKRQGCGDCIPVIFLWYAIMRWIQSMLRNWLVL